MATSEFKRGMATGVAGVVVVGWVVAVLAAWALTLTPDDEPPKPTAERLDAIGTVTSTEPTLCVEGTEVADSAMPQKWCGLVQPGSPASFLAEGVAVEGTLVGVETDPGSGSAFAVWETLTRVE